MGLGVRVRLDVRLRHRVVLDALVVVGRVLLRPLPPRRARRWRERVWRVGVEQCEVRPLRVGEVERAEECILHG